MDSNKVIYDLLHQAFDWQKEFIEMWGEALPSDSFNTFAGVYKGHTLEVACVIVPDWDNKLHIRLNIFYGGNGTNVDFVSYHDKQAKVVGTYYKSIGEIWDFDIWVKGIEQQIDRLEESRGSIDDQMYDEDWNELSDSLNQSIWKYLQDLIDYSKGVFKKLPQNSIEWSSYNKEDTFMYKNWACKLKIRFDPTYRISFPNGVMCVISGWVFVRNNTENYRKWKYVDEVYTQGFEGKFNEDDLKKFVERFIERSESYIQYYEDYTHDADDVDEAWNEVEEFVGEIEDSRNVVEDSGCFNERLSDFSSDPDHPLRRYLQDLIDYSYDVFENLYDDENPSQFNRENLFVFKNTPCKFKIRFDGDWDRDENGRATERRLWSVIEGYIFVKNIKITRDTSPRDWEFIVDLYSHGNQNEFDEIEIKQFLKTFVEDGLFAVEFYENVFVNEGVDELEEGWDDLLADDVTARTDLKEQKDYLGEEALLDSFIDSSAYGPYSPGMFGGYNDVDMNDIETILRDNESKKSKADQVIIAKYPKL